MIVVALVHVAIATGHVAIKSVAAKASVAIVAGLFIVSTVAVWPIGVEAAAEQVAATVEVVVAWRTRSTAKETGRIVIVGITFFSLPLGGTALWGGISVVHISDSSPAKPVTTFAICFGLCWERSVASANDRLLSVICLFQIAFTLSVSAEVGIVIYKQIEGEKVVLPAKINIL